MEAEPITSSPILSTSTQQVSQQAQRLQELDLDLPALAAGGVLPVGYAPPGSMDDSDDDSLSFGVAVGEQKEATSMPPQPGRQSENAVNGSSAKPKMGIRHINNAAPLRVAPITTLTLDF